MLILVVISIILQVWALDYDDDNYNYYYHHYNHIYYHNAFKIR